MRFFEFDGVSSQTFGTYVTASNMYDSPEEDVDILEIPYSNKFVSVSRGTFKPFKLKVTCIVYQDMENNLSNLRNFLQTRGKACVYKEFPNDDEFRIARYKDAFVIRKTEYDHMATFVLEFDCWPQRYLTTNTPITTTATADTTTDTTMSLSTVPTPISISLNGNTTQEGTPTPTNPQVIHNVSGDNEINVLGKNLIKINDYTTRTHNGMTFKALNDGGVLVNGTTTGNAFFNLDYEQGKCPYPKGVPLTISGGAMIGSYALEIDVLINGSTSARATTSGVTFTIPTTATEAFTRVRVPNSGVTIDNVIVHPLLEVGSTATTYEPYTRQSYPLYLPVENLLDSDLLLQASGWTETDGVYSGLNSTLHAKWGTNTDGIYNTFAQGYYYTFSFDLLQEDITLRNSLVVRFYYSDNTYDEKICTNNTSDFVNYSITNNSTTKTLTKLILSFGVTNNIYLKKVQLEKGVNANIYNPYGNPYIELNGIGTYQDYIYKNGGKWYVHKETYRLDLLSTYGYSMRTSGDIKYFTLSFGSTLPRSVNTFSGAFCNRFINGSTVTLGTFYITGTGSIFLCVPTDQTLASQLEFREWLSSNPTYAIIPLATPTNTEITDTTLINQLNNIEKAYSYNGTTNILQVSNDNGFMLSVVSLHSNNVGSNYKGEPIITVNSTGLIYFNGCVIKVNQAPMTINSQTMQAYNGTVNLNNYIEADGFPMIEAGNNVIGSEMPLSIVPNYWKL